MMKSAILATLFAIGAAVCPLRPNDSCRRDNPGGLEACTFSTLRGPVSLFCKPAGTPPDGGKVSIDTVQSLTCTWTQRQACAATTTLTECAVNTRPIYKDCCATCKPVFKLDCPDLSDCATGTRPTLKDGCPSCRISFSVCNFEKFKACAEADTPTCVTGERPVRTAECCLSCKPPLGGCGLKSDLLGRVTQCTTPFKDLAECADGKKPEFDTDTCCATCRPKLAPKPPRCSLQDFKDCAAKTPECASGERPQATTGCCKSCRRAETRCSLGEVVKQCSKLPACPAGERPVRTADSCCLSCRPTLARPTCEPGCKATEVCSRTKNGSGACRAAKPRELILKYLPAVKSLVGTLDADAAKTAIMEFVNRFCDKADNAKLCELIDKLKDRLLVKVTASITDGAKVEVTVADDDDDSSRRRLLAAGDPNTRPVDLLDAASNDKDAGGDFSMTDAKRVCPRDPRGNCQAVADATFTQECTFFTKKMFCKALTSIPTNTEAPPMTCTYEKRTACIASLANLTACPAGERPKFDYDTCCPTCRFTKPVVEEPSCPDKVPDCAGDSKPTRNDQGCLSCKIPVTKCTLDQLNKCRTAWPDLATCVDADGERPIRTEDCCLSCKPAPSACGGDKDDRSLDRSTRCNTAYKDIPACATDKKPMFNRDTCCPTCRMTKKAPAGDKCTADEFKACLKESTVCATGEEPQKTEGCCRSCRRPERKCKVVDVVKSCDKVPQCADDEKPVRVEGSCCPSCRPHRKKPTCTPACAESQRCSLKLTKDTEGKVTTPEAVCKPKKAHRLKLVLGSAVKDAAGNMTVDEVTATLTEIINRFCDKQNDKTAKLCDDKDAFIANMVVKLSKIDAATGEGEVEVETDGVAPSRRRLLQNGDLLTDAIADSEASDGFTFSDAAAGPATTSKPTSKPATSSASAVFLGAVTLLPVLLL